MLLLVCEYIFRVWADETTMLWPLRADFFGTILPIFPVPELANTDPPTLLLLEAYAFTFVALLGLSDVADLAESEVRLAAQVPRCSTGWVGTIDLPSFLTTLPAAGFRGLAVAVLGYGTIAVVGCVPALA